MLITYASIIHMTQAGFLRKETKKQIEVLWKLTGFYMRETPALNELNKYLKLKLKSKSEA